MVFDEYKNSEITSELSKSDISSLEILNFCFLLIEISFLPSLLFQTILLFVVVSIVGWKWSNKDRKFPKHSKMFIILHSTTFDIKNLKMKNLLLHVNKSDDLTDVDLEIDELNISSNKIDCQFHLMNFNLIRYWTFECDVCCNQQHRDCFVDRTTNLKDYSADSLVRLVHFHQPQHYLLSLLSANEPLDHLSDLPQRPHPIDQLLFHEASKTVLKHFLDLD